MPKRKRVWKRRVFRLEKDFGNKNQLRNISEFLRLTGSRQLTGEAEA
jgi:hypothetical protein